MAKKYIVDLDKAEKAERLALAAWGGIRQHRFDGTNLQPRKLPENATRTPSRLHALLDRFLLESDAFQCHVN